LHEVGTGIDRILAADGDDTPVVDDGQRRVTVPVSDGAGLLAGVVRELDEAGATLDEVFLALTGRPAEDGATSNAKGELLEPSAATHTGGR
jgi:ABC-2 type transport system ATP-binding protein